MSGPSSLPSPEVPPARPLPSSRAIEPTGLRFLKRRAQKFFLNLVLLPFLFRFPAHVTYRVLGLLGVLRYAAAWRKRGRVRRRVIEVLPHLRGAPDLEEIVKGIFVNAMKTRAREFSLASLSDEEFDRVVHLDPDGLDHIERALREGRGVLLLGAHVGPGRLVCYLLRRKGFPLVRVGVGTGDKPFKRRLEQVDAEVYSRLERAAGTRFHDILLPRDADPRALSISLKRMHSALKANNILYLAADGRASTNPVYRAFLGKEVGFPPGWVSLARMSRAAAIPAFVTLRRDSTEFHVWFGSPISQDLLKGNDPTPAVEWFVRQLEEMVRRYPWNATGIFLGRAYRGRIDAGWGIAFPPP